MPPIFFGDDDAAQEGLQQEIDQREHLERGQIRPPAEAGDCDRPLDCARGGDEGRKAEQGTEGEEEVKKGLYANIAAKRERIKEGSGEKMRKPGTKGAPTAKAFKQAAKTARKK